MRRIVDASPWSRCWRPVLAGLALLALLLAAVSRLVLQATDGRLVYALDDAYIHMSMAKHVALHDMWGVSADQFASASSSPFWTVLLALTFHLAGVHDVVPLVLNVMAAAALVVVIALMLDRERFTQAESMATIAGVMLFAPVMPMVWIGMEHSLNNVFVAGTAVSAVHFARQGSTGRGATLLLLISLACATRLEGLFVAAGCAVLLVLAGRVLWALACLGAAALPVLVSGTWNLAHGWFFFPTSVLMKQNVLPVGQSSWVSAFLRRLSEAEVPADVVAIVCVAALLLGLRVWRTRAVGPDGFLVVFLTAATLHLGAARFGYLYRYESYLMVLGVLAIAIAVHHASLDPGGVLSLVRGHDAVVALAVVAVFMGSARTIGSNGVLVTTAGHIHRQHRQMARFVARYYDASAVALNDIGAVSYGSNARVFDLGGLASLEVAQAKRAGTFDADFINAWLDSGQVPIAIVFDAWFSGNRQFYGRWTRVARWMTDQQDQLVEGAVTFYARTPADARRLRIELTEFQPTLPRGVEVEWTAQTQTP